MTASDNPNSSLSLREEAQRLSRTLHELQSVLRSQREILRQRGMNLPSGVMTLLEDSQINIQNLINTLKDEESKLRQLRALAETTAMINSSLDLDAVLNQAMDTVIRLTGAERGYLMLRNEETDQMEYRVARNLDVKTVEESAFTVSRSVINRVAETGEPVVTTNAQDDPRFSSQESIVSFALRSILCVPLNHKGMITGVIYADNRIRAGLFGDSELELLNAFANQAAVAIENARLFERVRVALAEVTEIKNLMADVFASIPSGVIVTDGENRIKTHNEAAGEILSLQPTHSIGYALSELIPTLAEGLQRLLESVRLENRRSTVELQADIARRGPRDLNLKLSPLRNADHETEGTAIVLDDMTEMRQREAQLNVIRRYLPPAMVDNIQSIAQLGLGGVRRDITVVYVDVRPMSTFPPGTTPKQQMEALNRYMAACSEPIHHYGGVIDKFMGTEIMALFNTQLNPSDTHEWDAIRAVLDISSVFEDLYAKQGEPPGTTFFRIGINSGIATMGNVGSTSRREFTAIGDTVNLAHRLVDLAKQGEIIVSQDVYEPCVHLLKKSQAAVTFTDRGKIEIRGRKQTVRIYQLQGETR
jgi:adenylate cyclase